MKTYARIQDGVVAELLRTGGDIARMFSPALIWIDVSSLPGITEGWTFDGSEFAPPPPPPLVPAAPTIADLQAQIDALSTQLAALAGKH